MPVQLGAKPQSSFDNPIGMLNDCHRRIEHFLDVLIKVAEQARGDALSDQQRLALETSLKYFRTGAPRHTEDEEDSLFPRMRACPDPRAREALDRIETLHAEHERADAAHHEIDPLGQRWLDQNRLDDADAQRLLQILLDLRETYRHHIAMEENDVFPVAARVLARPELQQVGREMAQRRAQIPSKSE